MQVSHTLITTDLSDEAMVALPHAATLARVHSSKVTVLHANRVWNGAADDSTVRDGRLDDVRRTLEAMGIAARVEVVDGDPAPVIDDYIAESSVDLVICTHHAASVASPLHNSISNHLVRTAKCPVLVAHGPSTPPTVDVQPATYSRVFVSSDFSKPSLAGLRATAELSMVLGATVVVGHVVEVKGLGVLKGDELVLPQTPDEFAARVKSATVELGAIVEDLYNDNVSVKVVCAESAAQGIVALALANECDLIVVPSHGKGPLIRLLLGSTAQAVLDLSPLPVLVLRRGRAERDVG